MAIINGGYKEYKLGNGLTVALQNTPSQTIAAKLRVNQGTYHEKAGEEGLAHFLEHCIYAGGTKKYTPTQSDKIMNSFGYVNAFTNLGRTWFIGGMLSEDIDNWLDYISDNVFNPRFDLKRVNGERERVLREISEDKSNPTYRFNKELNKILYGDHPKIKEVLGKEEVIKNATLEQLVDFHSRGFSPNNMELIIVGGLPENIQDSIEKNFGKYAPGNDTRVEFPQLKPLKGVHKRHFPVPYTVNKDNPEESSAGVLLNYNAPTERDPEGHYPFSAMNYLLGGDSNSLLYKRLGLEKGLAYTSNVNYNGSYNAGEASVFARVPINRADEAVDAIFGILGKMKRNAMTQKKVDDFKKTVKYNIARDFESNPGHIDAIEAKLDFGITPEMNFENWNKVSPESIKRIANEYLPSRNGNYVLSIMDPLKKED